MTLIQTVYPNHIIFHTGKQGMHSAEVGVLTPVLCFDLLTRPKMPFKVMQWKEVTHYNGSYERKSRGQKLADEMGRGKKIPWYSHRLTHRKRVTSELHDSYFRLMMIKHSIPKITWAIKWALNYYIAQSRQKSRQLSCSQLETRCGRESHIRPKGPLGPDELRSGEDADKMP